MGRNKVLLHIHAIALLFSVGRSARLNPRLRSKISPPFTYTPLTSGKKKICLWDKGQQANFIEGLQAALTPEGS